MAVEDFIQVESIEDFTSELTKAIQQHSVEITLKNIESDCFKAKIKKVSSEGWVILGNEKGVHVGDSLMMSMVLNDEKYLAQCSVQALANGWWPITLDFPKQIYRVQRRRNFRIRIPLSMVTTLQFPLANGKYKSNPLPNELIPVSDLSLGGARLILPQTSPLALVDKEIIGQLNLPKKVSVPIKAKVKHIEPVITSPAEVFVGIEFFGLDSSTENKLYSFSMEIYRDYIQKVGLL